MKLFNTLLRKIKYNLRYLFGAKISIPSEFKLFERRKTSSICCRLANYKKMPVKNYIFYTEIGLWLRKIMF